VAASRAGVPVVGVQVADDPGAAVEEHHGGAGRRRRTVDAGRDGTGPSGDHGILDGGHVGQDRRVVLGADVDTAPTGDGGVVVDEQRRLTVVVHGPEHAGDSVVEHGGISLSIEGLEPGRPP